MEYKDLFKIITSFLTPLELSKSLRLSRDHNKWTQEFILFNFKTLDLTEFMCPKCGDFIGTYTDLDMYTGFKNVYHDIDNEERRRYRYVDQIVRTDYKRKRLMCELCTDEEDEVYFTNYLHYRMEVSDSPFFSNLFRFKGTRKYTVCINNEGMMPWAFIFLEKHDGSIEWDEISFILPQLESQQPYYIDMIEDF